MLSGLQDIIRAQDIDRRNNNEHPTSNLSPLVLLLLTTPCHATALGNDSRYPDRHSADWGDIAADAVGAFGAVGMIWLVHKEW